MKSAVRFLLCALCLVLPVAANAASADLTWTPNSEADLAGYHVYRGNTTGTGACPVGPLQPLLVGGAQVIVPKSAAGAPLVAYTDATVPVFDGNLCYEVTAFDTANNESPRSNRASKAVNLVPPVAPSSLNLGAVR